MNSEIHTIEYMEDVSARIDKFLANAIPDLSRARVQGLIEGGNLKVNGTIVTSAKHKTNWGDTIELAVPPAVEWHPQAEKIILDVIYEDDDLIVINKQAGLTVHPGAGQKDGTLVNALLHHCGDSLSGIGGVLRPGIVHRLDKGTSGLMVVAKHDKAHKVLSEQFSDRSLSRRYIALVLGVPVPIKHTIDLPMGRHKTNRLKMAAKVKNAKQAVTHYTVMGRYPAQESAVVSMVECVLESGRTHQIRVHMEAIKHPVIGDPLYAAQKTALLATLRKGGYDEDEIAAIVAFPRQALHAYALSFIHPVTDEDMHFEAELPTDMQALLKILTK